MGASGSGKSSLALQLMAYGAELVADDQVILTQDKGLLAAAVPSLAGLIEARGLGILKADATPVVRLALAIDMDTSEVDRVPPARQITILGQTLPLLHKVEGIHFAPAVLQFLRAGRSEP